MTFKAIVVQHDRSGCAWHMNDFWLCDGIAICSLFTVKNAMQMPLSEKYMNRSERQQLIDEIIGEATLALLERAGPVSFHALIEQLQVMEGQSDDTDRRQLIAQTIAEVRKSIAEGERAKQQRAEGINSVQHLYTDSHHSGNNRKH